MVIHLSSTNQKAVINGATTRLWIGATDAGIACYAFIAVIAVEPDADVTEFAEVLDEVPQPPVTVGLVSGKCQVRQ